MHPWIQTSPGDASAFAMGRRPAADKTVDGVDEEGEALGASRQLRKRTPKTYRADEGSLDAEIDDRPPVAKKRRGRPPKEDSARKGGAAPKERLPELLKLPPLPPPCAPEEMEQLRRRFEVRDAFFLVALFFGPWCSLVEWWFSL